MADELRQPKRHSHKVERWLEGELGRRQQAVREVAEKNQKKMKEAMLDHAYRKARAGEFSEGAMVWVRTPGLSGKMDASWEGPFHEMQ